MDITPLPRKIFGAGSEVDAWCTRCKMDLGHRVVAMVGNTPKRVLCMTCSSEHNYRSPKSEDSPRVKKARTTAAKKTAQKKSAAPASQEEWQKKVRSGAPLRRYSVSEVFSVDDLVTHKKFGEGYVVEVLGDGKVSIRFIDGERTLVHGMKL